MKKSLPQSNAAHLTALLSRGTRFCLQLGTPCKIDRFAHQCSLFPPPAAVIFVARQRGRKRRAIRESPLRLEIQTPIFLVKNTQKTAIFPAVHAVDKAREKW